MADERPVLIIGSASVDIIARATQDVTYGTSNAGRITMSMGGVARNIAENLARLGQETILISAVGSDARGQMVATHAAQAGIDTSQMLLVPDGRSGSYLGLVDQDGKLHLGLADLAISDAITRQALLDREDTFKEASLVFLDANLPKKTIQTALTLARRAKVPVCADPTSVALAERLVRHLPRLHMITANASEASVLSGTPVEALDRDSAIAAAQRLVQAGVQIAAVTMAEFGVGYASTSTSGHVPAMRSRVVNQTGAGDAFTATTLFGHLNDIPLDESVRLGVTAAALTLQSEHTVLPDLSLDKLYDHLT